MLESEDPSLIVTASSVIPPASIQTSKSCDPTITFEDSPRNFNDYLSSMDQSINQCRKDIANHWDAMDLDHLLDSQEWQDLLNDDTIHDQPNQHLNDEENILNIDNLNMPLNIPLETPKKP